MIQVNNIKASQFSRDYPNRGAGVRENYSGEEAFPIVNEMQVGATQEQMMINLMKNYYAEEKNEKSYFVIKSIIKSIEDPMTRREEIFKLHTLLIIML